jgi:hypothetical protein
MDDKKNNKNTEREKGRRGKKGARHIQGTIEAKQSKRKRT